MAPSLVHSTQKFWFGDILVRGILTLLKANDLSLQFEWLPCIVCYNRHIICRSQPSEMSEVKDGVRKRGWSWSTVKIQTGLKMEREWVKGLHKAHINGRQLDMKWVQVEEWGEDMKLSNKQATNQRKSCLLSLDTSERATCHLKQSLSIPEFHVCLRQYAFAFQNLLFLL